jgi:3D (Asp-Asp-Asp) domain-containing protein
MYRIKFAVILLLGVCLPCIGGDNGKADNVDGKRYKVVEMVISYYCPCKLCCNKYGEKYTTADNTYFKGKYNFRCVAADRKFYKMGTKFDIDGVVYTMHDVGGAIKGNHLDVLVYPCADLKKCHKLALKLGKKKVMVKIYE